MPLPPADGIPLALGAIPFAFSAALFLLPLIRSLRRPAERARVARENGWRGVLQVVLTGRRGRIDLTGAELTQAWMTASGGNAPTETELRDAVRAAGGDVDVAENGQLIYRFEVLERELQATQQDRQVAAPDEASAGEVIFSSADEGPGMREGTRSTRPPPRAAPPPPPGTPPPPATPAAATRDPSAPGTRPRPAALPEVPETIPDRESAEELLARLGVDTRRRGR